MIRDIDILTHLPGFLRDYREFKVLNEVENYELQKISDETEVIKDNQFIFHTDEIGISRFEEMLGIKVDANDTLEIRQNRVYTKWMDNIPYTYKYLVSKLEAMLGVNGYEILHDFTNYYLKIITKNVMPSQTIECFEYVKEMIPVNLVFEIQSRQIETLSTYVGAFFMRNYRKEVILIE